VISFVSFVFDKRVSAPRYRMLPTETDLNTPPLLSNLPDKVLHNAAVQSKATGGVYIHSSFAFCSHF
jgi:hypothetical protein